jgi:hypothetical protein
MNWLDLGSALISSLVGGYMQNQAQQKAQKNQAAILEQMLAQNQSYQQQANNLVQQTVDTFQPQTRQQAMAAAEDEAQQRYLAALSVVGPEGKAPAMAEPTSGNVSQTYLDQRAGAARDVLDYAQRMARLTAKTKAPNQTLFDEGRAMAGMQQGVGQIANFAQGAAKPLSYAYQQAGNPDPQQMGLGEMMKGLGQGWMYSTLNSPSTKPKKMEPMT